MTSRSARLCLVVASSALAFNAFAQNPPPLPTNPPQQPPNAQPAQAGQAPRPGPAAPEEEVQLKLPDADIDTVLSALEIYTGKIILRPAQLTTATYNLKIDKPVPKSEAILYIETVLAMNGVGISPLGDRALKVVNLQNVKSEAPEMLTGSAFDQPASGKAAAKLFQLEFARAQEVQPLIQNILNPFYGTPVLLPNANALLITDSISNLQRVELLLQQLDKPMMAGMQPKFYPLTEAKASDVVNKLRTVIQGTLQQQLGSATSFSADDRTNQVILVTDPRQHEFFDNLIERFDQRADPMTRNDVIYLKHAKAADVVQVINKIITGQTTAIQRQNSGSARPSIPGIQAQPPAPTPGAPPQPAQPAIVSASNAEGTGNNEFSPFMTVVNDDRSNSIVVSGVATDIRLVKSLVDKLDIVLAQVRIEVVIAEVSLSDNNQSGISQLGLQIEGDKLVGFSAAAPGLSIGGNGENSLATITRPGLSGPWDLAGLISITTTPRKNNTTILSHPAIVTSHGKVSEIFSGETRPVQTGSVTSGTIGGTTSTTVQLRIGTRLNVTPFIGVDGSVQLELKQTVEDVIDEIIIDGNPQPIIGTRETSSYITAKSGDIIVLGGFQKNTGTRTTSRLGPIPIIGDIFGSRRKQENRQDLIFFLRPVVLTNKPEVDNASAFQHLEQMPHRDEIKRQLDPAAQPQKDSSVLDKILPR